MIAARRRHWNLALERAVHWATELRKPLLIVEALSCSYRWANFRFHTAILQGMLDNFREFENSGVLYYPFVERFPSQGKGMMDMLARRACVVVTDDFPAFDIPRFIAAAAAQSLVLVEKVDSNGIFPMRATERIFATAHSFRRFLQTQVRTYLCQFPEPDPLADVELPPPVCPLLLRQRWPAATRQELAHPERTSRAIAIDQSVTPVSPFVGGAIAGRGRLKDFVQQHFKEYAEGRNDVEADHASGLSPYLHFGHISAHEVFDAVMRKARWSSDRVEPKANGSREGWWHAGPDAEAFVDQLLTWREIGFNMCSHNPEYDRYESLPDWALKTL